MAKIVLLSSWRSPELPYFLESFRSWNLDVAAVVCAGQVSDKDRKILEARLEKSFFSKDLLSVDLTGVAFYFTASHNAVDARALLRSLKPDLLVNVGTPNILTREVLNIPRLGVLNCHPGLLPEYRGCTCVEWALYRNEPLGATCHFMTPEIDRGPILHRQVMLIRKEWGYRTIRTRMFFHQLRVLRAGIAKALKKNVRYSKLGLSPKGTYYGVIDSLKMREVLRRRRG